MSANRLIWILFAIVPLLSCAEDGSASWGYPTQGGGYVNSSPTLVMLNDQGVEGPGFEPSTGLAPFGVILGRTGNQNLCTVTHITFGRVVTNAHCFKDSRDPRDYTVFFYNHYGQKETAPVQRIVFMGDARTDDLAVLEVAQDADSRWDTAGNYLLPTDRFQGHGIRLRVNIWSYDPLTFHSDLVARYGSFGVVFNPRECSASRRLPQVIGVVVNDGVTEKEAEPPLQTSDERKSPVKEFEIRSAKNDAGLQVFLDGCDRPLVPGNSGSLLTDFRDFQLKLGVYQSGLRPPDPNPPKVPKFSYFMYTGSDGIGVKLRPEQLMGGEFFGWGTVFESVLRQHPFLFSAPSQTPQFQNIPWRTNPSYGQ